MKNSRLFFFSAVTAIFMISSCGSGQNYFGGKLKNAEDTVNYYLGITYGAQIKGASFDEIFNYKAFEMGIQDAIRSDTLPVSQIELETYLNMFFAELQEDQLAEQYKDYIAENEAFLEDNAKSDSVVSLPNGLQYIILTKSTGPQPTENDDVKVHYTGWLIDGTKFDSSFDRGEPIVFAVNGVIPGWSEIIKLMPTGSKWKVWIPANLAYGSSPPPGSAIIPYSTLVFEIELLEINPE